MARAKPMHSKGLWRPDSEEFSAHPEPSRTPAAHARGRPASSRLLCELLDRILAGVHDHSIHRHAGRSPTTLVALTSRHERVGPGRELLLDPLLPETRHL